MKKYRFVSQKLLDLSTLLVLVVFIVGCKNVTNGGVTRVGTEVTGIILHGMEYAKTAEKVIVPNGTTATIHMKDDSSWFSYYTGQDNFFKGVFIKDRSVALSPFSMGKYEVTQELYSAMMSSEYGFKSNPSKSNGKQQPVEGVSWYDAVYFCNVLTKKIMNYSDCVYIIDDIRLDATTGSITSASVTADFTKKGYRLPTEAEWEFSARGGNASSPAWNYAYAGAPASKSWASYLDVPRDPNLDEYAWFDNNRNGADTKEVGNKKTNTVGLYDMSGNVTEWCWDCYGDISTESVTNPKGSSSGITRVQRGGNFNNYPSSCAVSFRFNEDPHKRDEYTGFRVCRSL